MYKTLVYSPAVRVLIARGNEQIDVSQDFVRGNIQRNGDGVSFTSFQLANKGMRYTGKFRRMDRIAIWVRRVEWVQVFSGYLNRVPAVTLYPGLITVTASCTLKRLKYTYWDPGLTDSAALFDQAGVNADNGGDNKDAGIGFMLKNILEKVGGWDQNQIIVQDFPTAFIDYLAKGAEQWKDEGDTALAEFKKLFDYDEVMGNAGGGGTSMGPTTEGQKAHIVQIRAAAAERGLPEEAVIIAIATGLVESEIRILANPNVPGSMDFPHEGTGTDHDSVGIFQQRDNGAWGTLAQRMNAKASAGLFFNALMRFDWRSMDPGAAAQRVQGSAYPDRYAQRIGDAKRLAAEVPSGQNTVSAPKPGDPNFIGPVSPGTKAPAAPDKPPAKDPNAPDTTGMSIQESMIAVVKYKFPMMTITDVSRSEPGSLHDYSVNKAIDISNGGDAGTPEMKALAQWIYDNYLGKGLLQLIHHPFQHNVLNDKDVGDGMTDTGNGSYGAGTMMGHRNHVHWGMDGRVSADGTTDASSVAGAGGTSTGSSFQNKLAKNLFGYLFKPDNYLNGSSMLYRGIKASLNDEPLIETVNALCRARLCKYQSAPTGEFLAYYPDYFGLDGSPAKLDLEDIELKDFTIDLDDAQIVTHMFTSGTYSYSGAGASDLGFLSTSGVATVESGWLFDRLINAAVVPPETSNPQEFLETFGIRPLKENYSSFFMNEPGLELMIASQRFMQKWAEQTATNVSMTFMPILFPGMRINLVGHDVTVYVDSVNHTLDMESGFTTTATVMAPSRTSRTGGRAAEAGM